MIFRNLARLGAAALLTSGAFAALGAPAYAEDAGTDLSIDVAGTRLAAGTTDKVGSIRLTNRGADTPTGVKINIDVTQLDLDKVTLAPFAEERCAETEPAGRRVWECAIHDFAVPEPGTTSDLPLVVFRAAEGLKEAYAAPVTFTVVVPGDTNSENDSKTVQIELTTENGVDLEVWAPDVNAQVAWEPGGEPELLKSTLNPGDETIVFAGFGNQGDMIADGLDFVASLPEGVTFSERLRGCEVSADRRRATCAAGTTRLMPGKTVYGVFAVKVAADVPAPVLLSGGTVSATSRGALPVTDKSLARAAGGELPPFLTTTKIDAVEDIDPSDDSDDFTVKVAAVTGGGGGGDGGLPVTGPQAGLIGGVGVAVLAVGGTLFVLARRRRVVLVTPNDERPAA
ncbi:cell wall anchor protein [Micromonospora sp. S4605]|uniref:cell wall anchor protein n=1 Tax=Micromonospora sp. S4605 TaxID=1420897 RepID=UPI000D6EE767|nr:cell wall anchor protein [Micromonospora sp. S4605]PWU51443.1 cell wall anchor protein [Micromonospora sp. S4605]